MCPREPGPRHQGGRGCQQHCCTRPPGTHRQSQGLFCKSTALLALACCAPREGEGSCSVGGAALREKHVPCAAEPRARRPALSLHHPWARLHHWLLQTSRVKLLCAKVKTILGESHRGKQQQCVSYISAATKSIFMKPDLTFNSFFFPWIFPHHLQLNLPLVPEPGDLANQCCLQSFLSPQQTPFLCCVCRRGEAIIAEI